MIANVSAQNNELLVQLVDYNSNTQQSKIHIQNTAGFELNELDFYINNIKTGRIANNLADGKAVVYFQTITPGTYDVTIKTKEGIEFTKQIKFTDLKQQATETEEETQKPKTASQLAEDPKYQKFLDMRKKEEELAAQKVIAEKVVERKEDEKGKLQELIVKKAAEKSKYNPITIASILIFIFVVFYIFKKKKRIS